MRKRRNFLTLAVIFCAAACLFLPLGEGKAGAGAQEPARGEETETMKDGGLDYRESTENFINPERGFYQALSVTIPEAGSSAWWSVSTFSVFTRSFGLLHLRLGLENFSAAAGGKDEPISKDALDALGATLDALRTAGGTAIVRFSYNVSGAAENGKYLANEPSMELIERHIAQLGAVIKENTDVVAGVETGMLGPWGEQHSTPLASSGEETYYRLVEAWLRAVPETRTISVRRPLYYIYWANRKYGKELTQDTLGEETAAEGSDARRVGVYNDGYLGSSSDLGTFKNREAETGWLSRQATHTLYGGEVVADSETGLLGAYNDVDYLEQEAFVTHTSYLNISWNDRVVAAWKKEAYDGKDGAYAGKSDYDYVAAHLGYRFVLRKSELSEETARGGMLRLKGSVENVGFGNVVNRKIAQILLVSPEHSYVCLVDWDVRKIFSRETKEYDWRFRLPADIPAGNYGVYLKIRDAEEKSSSNLRALRFANEGAFDADLGANKLGETTISSRSDPEGGETFEQIGGESDQGEFVVRFASDGTVENLPAEVRTREGDYLTLPQGVPTRTGYLFTGWSDGEKTYEAGGRYRVLQNITLRACWEKTVCFVRFDGNGGRLISGEETQKIPYGESAAPPVYEKTGCVFAGWSGSVAEITGDTTIFAVWKANVYTVRFLSREEAALREGSASQEVEYGKPAVPPVYVREGYRLVGWNGKYDEITDHCVCYAVWEKVPQKGCKSEISGAFLALGLFPAAVGLLKKRNARKKPGARGGKR